MNYYSTNTFGTQTKGGNINSPLTNPDILDQNPYFTQSYNRYAYVVNNPLKYTDPSGYMSDGPPIWVLNNPMIITMYYGQMAMMTEDGYLKDHFEEFDAFWAIFDNISTGGGGLTSIGGPLNHNNKDLKEDPKTSKKSDSRFGFGKKTLDFTTSPYFGFGIQSAATWGDDLFRGLSTCASYTSVPLSGIAAYAGLKNLNEIGTSDASIERVLYHHLKVLTPIAIDLAGYATAYAATGSILSTNPLGWVALGAGVALEGAELFYDRALVPAVNYLVDYSNRWDQWFTNQLYNYHSW